MQQSSSKSWTVLTGPMPTVPCHPTLAHFWKGEGTRNRTKLPHMKRKHATRPAIQWDVSRILPGRLQSRTKHLTGQVYALSPHIPVRLAAQGRWLGFGIRSLLVARETIAVHASSLITPSYFPHPTGFFNWLFQSESRKWCQLLKGEDSSFKSVQMWFH